LPRSSDGETTTGHAVSKQRRNQRWTIDLVAIYDADMLALGSLHG